MRSEAKSIERPETAKMIPLYNEVMCLADTRSGKKGASKG